MKQCSLVVRNVCRCFVFQCCRRFQRPESISSKHISGRNSEVPIPINRGYPLPPWRSKVPVRYPEVPPHIRIVVFSRQYDRSVSFAFLWRFVISKSQRGMGGGFFRSKEKRHVLRMLSGALPWRHVHADVTPQAYVLRQQHHHTVDADHVHLDPGLHPAGGLRREGVLTGDCPARSGCLPVVGGRLVASRLWFYALYWWD